MAICLNDKLIFSFFVIVEYLEKQRRWAETGAVRDLEFEGDNLLKALSAMCKHDRKTLTKDLAGLSVATHLLWKAIDKKSRLVWASSLRWRLTRFTDDSGRRILLDPNLRFDSHESARYDSMLGQGRHQEEKESKEHILQSEISDLMKRNSEALTSYDQILALEDSNDDDDDEKEESDEKEYDEGVAESEINEISSTHILPESSETEATEDGSVIEELNHSGDEWAKVFIWEDAETIVAR